MIKNKVVICIPTEELQDHKIWLIKKT